MLYDIRLMDEGGGGGVWGRDSNHAPCHFSVGLLSLMKIKNFLLFARKLKEGPSPPPPTPPSPTMSVSLLIGTIVGIVWAVSIHFMSIQFLPTPLCVAMNLGASAGLNVWLSWGGADAHLGRLTVASKGAETFTLFLLSLFARKASNGGAVSLDFQAILGVSAFTVGFALLASS